MKLRARLGAAALGAAFGQLIGDWTLAFYLVSGLGSTLRFGVSSVVIAVAFVVGPVPIGALGGWVYPNRVLRAGLAFQDRLARSRLL
jgi:hypothetical protein